MKRLTISVPDDVADRVDREANVSAYVTDAVRARIHAERLTTLLRDQGVTISPEGRALARAKLDAADRAWPPERYADARQRWLGDDTPAEVPDPDDRRAAG